MSDTEDARTLAEQAGIIPTDRDPERDRKREEAEARRDEIVEQLEQPRTESTTHELDPVIKWLETFERDRETWEASGMNPEPFCRALCILRSKRDGDVEEDDYEKGWRAECVGETVGVDLIYPRSGTGPSFVEVGIEDTRSADTIRVSYDYDRDGYRIEQAPCFGLVHAADEDMDQDWQEVAFIQAWGRS